MSVARGALTMAPQLRAVGCSAEAMPLRRAPMHALNVGVAIVPLAHEPQSWASIPSPREEQMPEEQDLRVTSDAFLARIDAQAAG